jgi:hypothetical protein
VEENHHVLVNRKGRERERAELNYP